jgi:phenylalanyl-tRNA synthetase beta chain
VKVLYSQLKKYLPDLKADAREVAHVYTMTGFMIDKFFEVEYLGKKDFLLDLEVRQNRADSFGVLGLARELSAYYNIPLRVASYQLAPFAGLPIINSKEKLSIEVRATKAVKRVMALKINNLRLEESPSWLKEYLSFYDINPINTLVDLTNYVMIETAHPSHAFDADLSGDNLVWEINREYNKMTSLDGTEIDLVPEALVVSNGKEPLAIAGIVGGTKAAINPTTKNIIIEMAVYDGGLIRRNSRQMKVMTEASSRLEKYIDPNSLPDAFAMLISLIQEYCGGEIASEVYENYLQVTAPIEINVSLDKVQQIAGIEISYDESLNYLKRLGFEILEQPNENNHHVVKVIRPINRLDIEQEEDVFEEIIRLKGFEKLPTDKLNIEVTKDITPKHLHLIDTVTNHLVSRGFDEVRSWVLVSPKSNELTNYESWEEIQVTNSINEEVPSIRQSVAMNLIDQLDSKQKNNVNQVQIFEIGKVFGKKSRDYQEHYSLGLLINNGNANNLKKEVENLLGSLGLVVFYEDCKKPPKVAHPRTCWEIRTIDSNKQKHTLGIIYVSNKTLVSEFFFAEINLNLLDKLISQSDSRAVQEISGKIVTLDTNLELNKDKNVREEIIAKLLPFDSSIWNWEIIDIFENGNKVKYTLRISYMHLTDPEAKKLHEEIFK